MNHLKGTEVAVQKKTLQEVTENHWQKFNVFRLLFWTLTKCWTAMSIQIFYGQGSHTMVFSY